jgi:hypothetical protein
MQAPDKAEVYAAELKFALAAQDTVNSARRARAALRSTLAQPSTLAWLAGAAAFGGFMLARKTLAQEKISGRRRVQRAPKASTAAFLMAFVLREGLRRLPLLAQLCMARGATAVRQSPRR